MAQIGRCRSRGSTYPNRRLGALDDLAIETRLADLRGRLRRLKRMIRTLEAAAAASSEPRGSSD